MPSLFAPRHQRAWGGALGVILLGVALIYHFFPRVFHVDPSRVDASGGAPGHAGTELLPISSASVQGDERFAGPPLILAPSEVVAARMHVPSLALPVQKSQDTPQVRKLVTRAAHALHDGRLAGEDGAAALYLKASRIKPDSRAAAQGVFDTRNRLVAQAGQEIALGDAEAAADLLVALRSLPGSTDAVAQLEGSLKTLMRIRPLLVQAARLLQQGNADHPVGRSALDVYRQAQQLDPQNAVAEQGIYQVQRAVLDRVLAALAQNDFASAEKLLRQAEAILPGSPQLLEVHGRMEDMRRQRAENVLAQARAALDAGNLPLATQLTGQARGISLALDGLADMQQRLVNARLYASYRPGQVFVDRFMDMLGQTPTMVVVSTGRFLMGSDDGGEEAERPVHEVTLDKGFALARGAVTVEQFRTFVKSSGYVPDAQRLGGASIYDERSGSLRDDAQASWDDDYEGHPAAADLPVINVSWNDAHAYADWLSQRTGKLYRLPSEAEFEYALRAGTRSRYWWGDGAPASPLENIPGSGDRSARGRRWAHAFPNYRDGYWGPAPVMHFTANPFGLYDMDGNVSEWVSDCWHDSYLRAPQDGSAWINPGCAQHVVRGGSWASSPDQVRSTFRQGGDASLRSARVGFRVAREL